jgi:hypothetical protein
MLGWSVPYLDRDGAHLRHGRRLPRCRHFADAKQFGLLGLPPNGRRQKRWRQRMSAGRSQRSASEELPAIPFRATIDDNLKGLADGSTQITNVQALPSGKRNRFDQEQFRVAHGYPQGVSYGFIQLGSATDERVRVVTGPFLFGAFRPCSLTTNVRPGRQHILHPQQPVASGATE